jgi:hypothetical protein
LAINSPKALSEIITIGVRSIQEAPWRVGTLNLVGDVGGGPALNTTSGTRTGLFDHLNDFFNNNPNIAARLQPIEVYAPNGVTLVYVAPAPGQSPNPIPPIIDVIPTPLPPVAPEESLPLSFVVAALNPTIEQLTSMFEIPFSGANTQRFNLDNRLAEIQRGSTGFVSTIPTVPQPEPKAVVSEGKSVVEKQSPAFQPTRQNRWGVWVNGWGDWASVDDDASIKGYNFTTGGAVSVSITTSPIAWRLDFLAPMPIPGRA